MINLELYWALESLAKPPICWNNVCKESSLSISSCDLKGQRLAIEISIRLPINPPVSWHCQPACFWAFNGHRLNGSSSSYIGNQDELKVVSSINSESDSTMLLARNPAALNHIEYLIIYKKKKNWKKKV